VYEIGEVNARKFFESKTILITGACGTIGRNIARQLLGYKLAGLRLLDTDDTTITELKDELEYFNKEGILRYLVGNIRDKERLIRAFERVDYVFHCAALKHVAIGEYNPREVILTNVNGTENVIEAALRNNVKKVVYTSSDKAVNPVNTMGASKLLGEKSIVAANFVRGSSKTRFSAVRFGNVLGSRGSILKRFEKRVKKNLPLIVTDPDMTRFMMPISDAVNLTLKAMVLSEGGEIFVLKMPSLILSDLIDIFMEHVWKKYSVKPEINLIGLFPGEKTYEELMTDEELSRALETKDMYLILPHIKELLDDYPKNVLDQRGNILTKSYSSQHVDPISKNDLKKLLTKANLLRGI
jgi:FlaA1/EpsC-like NDP-sugar epimerase